MPSPLGSRGCPLDNKVPRKMPDGNTTDQNIFQVLFCKGFFKIRQQVWQTRPLPDMTHRLTQVKLRAAGGRTTLVTLPLGQMRRGEPTRFLFQG